MQKTTDSKRSYSRPLCEILAFTTETALLSTSAGVGDMPVHPASIGDSQNDLFSSSEFIF